MALIAYWIAHATSGWPGTPTGAQIAAGNLSNSSPASYSGSESGFATSGTIQIDEATAITGLSSGTSYTTAWTVYDDVALTYATPVVGAVTTAVTLSATAGVATSSTLTGQSSAAASFTEATGSATASSLVGAAAAAAAITAAAGAATASTVTGASSAAAAFTSAAGAATASTLVGNADAAGAGAFVVAAGVATASSMAGASAAAAAITPAAGVATTATLGETVVAYTSAGVFYIPIRMVSALWSAGSVGGATGEVAWLPPVRQPVAYTDKRTGQMLCDPAWYRFFEYVAETRLAGKTGPTLTSVVQTLTATQTTSAAAASVVTELQQQTQANAESLSVVRTVAKLNLLEGWEQIPDVEL